MANGSGGPITRLPIWRLDGPLVAAAQTLLGIFGSETATAADSASVFVLPQPGFFASQVDDLPAPYYRYRPYLWHRGALVSPGTANAGSGLISDADLAAAAETPTNVLLDNLATETATGADVGTLVASAAATETGTGSEAATNVLLGGLASEGGTGSDTGSNIGVSGAAETANASDSATVYPFPQAGFFASQGIGGLGVDDLPGPYSRQRPYWRYDGPLLAAAVPGTPVAISASDAAAASDASVNVLLAGVDDPVSASDLAGGVLLVGATEATTSADGVSGVSLSGVTDSVAAGDTAPTLGLGGAEAGSGVDFAVVLVLAAAAAGFFSSRLEEPGPQYRQRPYWRYDGPLLSPGMPALGLGLTFRVDSLEPSVPVSSEEPAGAVDSLEPALAFSTEVRGQ